jgi:hypothetical protein
MQMKMTQFEVKHSNTAQWESVSEKTVMERLLDTFSLVTPVISEMIKGKYAYTPYGIYRMKLDEAELKDEPPAHPQE